MSKVVDMENSENTMIQGDELQPVNEDFKVIFLDIDGVLNGYNIFTFLLYRIFYFLHKEDWLNKHYNIFGVHPAKVKRLRKIVDATGAKVVLCSSWRFHWFKVPFENQSTNCQKLSLLFFKHDIDVIGITPNLGTDYEREDEVNSWILNSVKKVTSFVILDDEPSMYPHMRTKHLVQTSTCSPDDMICGAWTENTGLRNKHVREAIAILNSK